MWMFGDRTYTLQLAMVPLSPNCLCLIFALLSWYLVGIWVHDPGTNLNYWSKISKLKGWHQCHRPILWKPSRGPDWFSFWTILVVGMYFLARHPFCTQWGSKLSTHLPNPLRKKGSWYKLGLCGKKSTFIFFSFHSFDFVEEELQSQMAWAWTLALPLTGCLTWSKWFSLPLFSHQ